MRNIDIQQIECITGFNQESSKPPAQPLNRPSPKSGHTFDAATKTYNRRNAKPMLLLTISNPTPQSLINTRLTVRSSLAALYLSLKTNLQIIARNRNVSVATRCIATWQAQDALKLIDRYQALARKLTFSHLTINTKMLELSACAVATHITKGEIGAARRIFNDALHTEAELSEIATLRAFDLELAAISAAKGQALAA